MKSNDAEMKPVKTFPRLKIYLYTQIREQIRFYIYCIIKLKTSYTFKLRRMILQLFPC